MVQKLQVLGNTIYSKEINKNTKYFNLKTVANISTGKEDANFASPNGKYNFYTCSSEIIKWFKNSRFRYGRTKWENIEFWFRNLKKHLTKGKKHVII